jgi:hypothetical protein
MGQYYKIANLDKREYIEPYPFGDGVKLMEFSMNSGGMLTALAVLLASSNGNSGGDLHLDVKSKWRDVPGRWAGDRIVIAGDYDDRPGSPGCGIYDACNEQPNAMGELVEASGERIFWKDISHLVLGCLLEDVYFRDEFLKLPAPDSDGDSRWRNYRDKMQREAWKKSRPREKFPREK